MKKFLVYGYTSEFDSSDLYQPIKVVSSEERAKELSEEWQAKKTIEDVKFSKKSQLQNELYVLICAIQHKPLDYSTRPKLPVDYNMSKATAKDLGYTDEMWKNYVKQNAEIHINIKEAQKKWDEDNQNIHDLIRQERERITKEYVDGLSPEDKVIWDYVFGTLQENYTYEEVDYED